VIEGTSGADVFKDFPIGTQTAYCGYTVWSAQPNPDAQNRPRKFEVNLSGGDDVAFIFDRVRNLTVRGGAGNDFLRALREDLGHHALNFVGGEGNDIIYGGNMSGDGGNDTLCEVTASTRTPTGLTIDGGLGTDSYCGPVSPQGTTRIEAFSPCPAKCQGLFGW